MFDPANLGRGKLGALKENNYEFGAWDPVDGKSVAKSKSSSSEPPVAEARSGQGDYSIKKYCLQVLVEKTI